MHTTEKNKAETRASECQEEFEKLNSIIRESPFLRKYYLCKEPKRWLENTYPVEETADD